MKWAKKRGIELLVVLQSIPACCQIESEEISCLVPERMKIEIDNLLDISISESGNPILLYEGGASEVLFDKKEQVSLDSYSNATGITYSSELSGMISISSEGIISDKDGYQLHVLEDHNIDVLENDFKSMCLASQGDILFTVIYDPVGRSRSDRIISIKGDTEVKDFVYTIGNASGLECRNDVLYYLRENGELRMYDIITPKFISSIQLPILYAFGIAFIGDCMFVFDNDNQELVKLQIPSDD